MVWQGEKTPSFPCHKLAEMRKPLANKAQLPRSTGSSAARIAYASP
jgi:hypothetical protein